MSQELVISSNPIETTVAILENDRLVEIYVEHHAQKAITGSIYKGRVSRVLPGMQSAFVNLGLQRDAFLYVTDVLDPADALEDDLDRGPLQVFSGGEEPSVDAAAEPQAGDEASVESSEPDQQAQRSPGAADRPARRRSRRRRRSGRSEARTDRENQEGVTATPDDAAEPEPPEEVGPEPVTLLPGESLAKYRNANARNTGDPKGDDSAGGGVQDESLTQSPEAEGASASLAASEPIADREQRVNRDGHPGGVSDQSVTLTAQDAAIGRDPTVAESNAPLDQDADRSEGPGGRGGALSKRGRAKELEPTEGTVTVSPPSTLAELRMSLLWWRKRKGAKSDKGARQEEDVSADRGSATKATSAEESRPAPRVRPGAPRKRSARKTASSKRSSDSQPSRNGSARRERQPGPQANIKDLLTSGQEVIVQVTKEPVGAKGARITSHVSLPGRYMVYMTTAKHNGVARKIQPEQERSRLRKIVDKYSEGKPGGFVVRTAGRGIGEEDLRADIEFLSKLWIDIQDKAEKRKAPAKLHSDLGIVERVLRDHLGQSYKTIWVDSEDEYQRIVRFIERFQPSLLDRVKLYTRQEPIYDSFRIARDLEKAMRPKVWLKSGGYLVINQTEALVAIDVNTGRYVGKSDRLEDTVLKTNLEAANEIVRQLRLRDLGGIIVIDFIDMEDRKNRQKVHQVLQEALRQVRSPTRLLPFNDFGLVVITRKAVRQSLERSLCMPCPTCSGAGTVKSSATVLSEIFSAASRLATDGTQKGSKRTKEVTLRVHPEIAKSLKLKSNSHLEDLEQTFGTNVLVRGDASLHPEQFHFD